MNQVKKTLGGLLASLALIIGSAALAPAAAQATVSCGAYVPVHAVHYQGDASYCPMWKGNVPVYSMTSTGAPGAVVGYLVDGGDANWFVCHWSVVPASKYTAYGYTSYDWASTVADNGAKGWVSAVFFDGTQPYWPGLVDCAAGFDDW